MALLSRLTSSNQLTESYVRNTIHFHNKFLPSLLLLHLLRNLGTFEMQVPSPRAQRMSYIYSSLQPQTACAHHQTPVTHREKKATKRKDIWSKFFCDKMNIMDTYKLRVETRDHAYNHKICKTNMCHNVFVDCAQSFASATAY